MFLQQTFGKKSSELNIAFLSFYAGITLEKIPELA